MPSIRSYVRKTNNGVATVRGFFRQGKNKVSNQIRYNRAVSQLHSKMSVHLVKGGSKSSKRYATLAGRVHTLNNYARKRKLSAYSDSYFPKGKIR